MRMDQLKTKKHGDSGWPLQTVAAAALWALTLAAPDLAQACCDASEILGTSEDGDVVVFMHSIPYREHAYCVASKTKRGLNHCFSFSKKKWRQQFASAEKKRTQWFRQGMAADPRAVRVERQKLRNEFLQGAQRYLKRRQGRQVVLGWHGHHGLVSPDEKYRVTTSGDFITLLQIEDRPNQITFPVAAFIPRAPPFKTWIGAEYFRTTSLGVFNGDISPLLLRKVVWGKDKVVILVGVHDGKCGVNDRIYEIKYADLRQDVLGDLRQDLLRIARVYFSGGRVKLFRGDRMWSCPWKIEGEGSGDLQRLCEQYSSRGRALMTAGTGIASLTLARKLGPLPPRSHYKMISKAVHLYRWGSWDYLPFVPFEPKAKRVAYRAAMRTAFKKYLTELVRDFSIASPSTEVKRFARSLHRRSELRKVLGSLKANEAIEKLAELAGGD